MTTATSGSSATASITPNILRYLVIEAAERGVDLRPSLLRAGIDPGLAGAGTMRISYRQGSAVIRDALRLLGDSGVGLDVGRRQRSPSWGLVGFLLQTAPDFATGSRTATRFQRLAGAMVEWDASIERDGVALRLGLQYADVDPAIAVFLLDEALASSVSVARDVTGLSGLTPVSLTLGIPPPPHTARYATFFDCPVHFGQQTRLLLGPVAQIALPGSDPWVHAEVLELLDELTGGRQDQQDLVEGLQHAIAVALPDVPSIGEQAALRGLSERTLRRRLVECGLSYSQVVDEVRQARAEHLLARTSVRLADIPGMLGYQDQRTLRRAVVRWYGMTPSALRRLRAAERDLSTLAQPVG